jgi:alkylated DNA repair dioxygenase AlkB
MEEIKKQDIDLKPKTNPLVASLPDYLKNPANYQEIQMKIIESVMTTCSHSDIGEFARCPKCTEKMLERRKLLKKLGFKNPAQYKVWQQIHQEIRKRLPLIDWKKENSLRMIEDLKKK